MKARSPNLSVDRGKNKSKFDADLRTVGRVESVKAVLDCQIVLVRLANSSTLVGQQRQNTGRRRWSVYVWRRTSH